MLPSIFWVSSLAILGWSLFMFVLKPYLGFSFVRTPLRTLTYFILVFIVIALWFIEDSVLLLANAPWEAYVFAGLVLFGINPWLYRFSHKEHVHRIKTVFAHAHLELLALDSRFLFSKIGDVLFQQLVAGILILELSRTGLSFLVLSVLFAVVFALGHIGLVFRIPHRWAIYFLLSALLGGALLPLVYQNLPGAFYYCVALHMLWYTMTGAFHARAETRAT